MLHCKHHPRISRLIILTHLSLTIFLVAIVDWAIMGIPLSAAAIAGGMLIIAAFLLLSYSTYREMNEEAKRKKSVFLSQLAFTSCPSLEMLTRPQA